VPISQKMTEPGRYSFDGSRNPTQAEAQEPRSGSMQSEVSEPFMGQRFYSRVRCFQQSRCMPVVGFPLIAASEERRQRCYCTTSESVVKIHEYRRSTTHLG